MSSLRIRFYLLSLFLAFFLWHNSYLDSRPILLVEPWVYQARIIILGAFLIALVIYMFLILLFVLRGLEGSREIKFGEKVLDADSADERLRGWEFGEIKADAFRKERSWETVTLE